MFPVHLGYVALELARERAAEAAEQRLAAESRRASRHGGRPNPPAGPIRRSLARSAAAVSRTAADVARRLDRPTADELADWRQSSFVA